MRGRGRGEGWHPVAVHAGMDGEGEVGTQWPTYPTTLPVDPTCGPIQPPYLWTLLALILPVLFNKSCACGARAWAYGVRA